MKHEVRSQRSGNAIRPSTEVRVDSTENLATITTTWGAQEAADVFCTTLAEYVMSSSDDSEATTPFPLLTDLNRSANRLRVGVFLGNEAIYRKFNAKEYTSGLEAFSVLVDQNEISFVHYGSDYVFWIQNATQKVFPLAGVPSLQFGDQIQTALPSRLIGIEPRIEFSVGSFRFSAGDKILLVGRDHVDYGDLLKSLATEGIDTFLKGMDPKKDSPIGVAVLTL